MPWQFEEWRVFKWMGGNAARLLVVAGSIAAGALVWWLRPGGGRYFTMRDAAEISGAIIERRMARVNHLGYYDEPGEELPRYGGVWNYFASTNGSFWTNALARYAMHDYFDAVEEDVATIYSLTGMPYLTISPYDLGERAWVDLDDAGGFMPAYDGMPLWDVAGVHGGTNHPYAMQRDWYTANVHDHADGQWIPRLAIGDAARSYVQTSTVHVIGRALSACRWTVEYDGWPKHFGIAGEGGLVNGEDDVALLWSYIAEGDETDTYSDLLALAIVGMAADEPEIYISPVTETLEQMLAALDYATIDEHYARITLYENSVNDSPRVRQVRLDEWVGGEVNGTVANGTNYTAYCTGGIETSYYARAGSFFHTDYGQEMPGVLLGAPCGRWQACDFYGTEEKDNAYVLGNRVIAWDGRFPDAAWLSFLPEAPEPRTLSVATNYYFGWQSIDTNRAIVIDWRFTCLTNREAFW